MTTPVNSDQLRVTVEMGDDYQPSERLAAALSEFGAALTEDDAEVEGFGLFGLRSFTFNVAPLRPAEFVIIAPSNIISMNG